MLSKRIIPCLDVKEGKVVKGVNFKGLQEVGDPVRLAKQYDEQGADEIVFLDISATHEGRDTMVDVVKQVAKSIFIPFTVGGGIRTIEDIRKMLLAGADKVSLNSSAIANPNLIKEASTIFGAQCIVVAIDAKQREDKSGYDVYVAGGRKNTGIDLMDWVHEVILLGAGEILLTSMDADGTKQGFDIEMLKLVNEGLPIPLIASGGCGKIEHMEEVLKLNVADAVLAASIFHYGTYPIPQVKQQLKEKGIVVRIHE